MSAFREHHEDSIRFGYRCFDRRLLNGLIQPFQQPERVVRFFTRYRDQYPLTRQLLRDIANQYHAWIEARARERRSAATPTVSNLSPTASPRTI